MQLMCGRYEVHTPVEELVREFDAVLRADPAQLPPRYNVAPSVLVPVVRVRKGERELASLSWGLLPSWSKKAQGNRPINARAESLFEKPMFRNAIAKRRCLIPADGFYEWQQHPAGKQPWHIGMIDDSTFALGGIWEYWAIEGQEPVLSCAIIVTEANELVRKMHERMPLIIAREDWDRWLDPELTDEAEIEQLLKPFPAEEMRAYPVSSRVNNVKNDDAGLIEPAG
jgi:putative SOS response-associated peptidase YedK